MTDDDRKALGPEGVAVAEALGRGLPGVFSPVSAWLTLLDGWWWDDCESAPPPCPTITDATAKDVWAALVDRSDYLTSAVVDALLAEIRRTRAERDAARQERDRVILEFAPYARAVGAIDSHLGSIGDHPPSTTADAVAAFVAGCQAAEGARDAALDALENMVRQHCGPEGTAEVSARGLSADAEAIELLAEAGRIVIEGGEGGRTVYGRWVR